MVVVQSVLDVLNKSFGLYSTAMVVVQSVLDVLHKSYGRYSTAMVVVNMFLDALQFLKQQAYVKFPL